MCLLLGLLRPSWVPGLFWRTSLGIVPSTAGEAGCGTPVPWTGSLVPKLVLAFNPGLPHASRLRIASLFIFFFFLIYLDISSSSSPLRLPLRFSELQASSFVLVSWSLNQSVCGAVV